MGTVRNMAGREKAPSAIRIPALDGLRGVAILSVFCFHYGSGATHSNSMLMRWASEFCGFGWSGVDLFFVLSGFLITGILYDTMNDEKYFVKFYARRTLRIFPIYYLFAAIMLLVVPFASWHKGDLFFLVYLGYPAVLIWPSIGMLPVRIAHLWSLSSEEQFYLLWPWLIRKLRTRSNILMFCAALGIGSLAFRIVFPSWAYNSLPARVDDLGFGAALSVLYRSPLWKHCKMLAMPTFVLCVTAVLLIFVCRHTADPVHTSDRLIRTLGLTLIGISYGALLVLSMGPVAGFFSLRLLRTFGKYSYGMYLYHFPLAAVFEHAKPVFMKHPFGQLTYVTACLAGNLAIAAVSFHLFEQPILNMKKHFEYSQARTDSSNEVVLGHV